MSLATTGAKIGESAVSLSKNKNLLVVGGGIAALYLMSKSDTIKSLGKWGTIAMLGGAALWYFRGDNNSKEWQ